MLNQSEQINELAAALAKAQGEIKSAKKDTANTFFKSKYADLDAVWEAARVPLSKNGLSVIQTTDHSSTGTGLVLVTTLCHSSGQFIKGIYPIVPIKNDPQGQGSALSYGRRYALAAIVGITQADDDAEHAMGRSYPNAQSQQQHVFLDSKTATNQATPTVDAQNSMGGEYRVPFGKKYLGQTFNEMGYENVLGYLNYLEAEAKRGGQPTKGDALVYVQNAEKWLGNYENRNFTK